MTEDVQPAAAAPVSVGRPPQWPSFARFLLVVIAVSVVAVLGIQIFQVVRDQQQLERVRACLANASSAAQQSVCLDAGQLGILGRGYLD